ncbi:hypothetical protein HanPSC8_Chr13g0593261 [Helianthus annuus]|nr:hypothetical protein HanPSC8_Chr13g0593261 [Helianthus annuus]
MLQLFYKNFSGLGWVVNVYSKLTWVVYTEKRKISFFIKDWIRFNVDSLMLVWA